MIRSAVGKIFVLAAAAACCCRPVWAAEETPLVLVKDRTPLAAVVLPDHADAGLRTLAERFVKTVQRGTKATLPIVEESQVKEEASKTYLYLGKTQRAKKEGIRAGELPDEAYRMVRRGNALIIVGRDGKRPPLKTQLQPESYPTLWALNKLLEDSLGVRWLWPGELGTYVPDRPSMAVAVKDVTFQPVLRSRALVPAWTMRTLRSERPPSGNFTPEEREAIIEAEQESIRASVDWLENHQGGERGNVIMPSHAFTKWWQKYGKEHPDYFAKPPEGEELALYRPGSIKLRLSNPAVVEQIAKEYKAAGAPKYWSVMPNDAAGFDTSEETLAWDLPQGQNVLDIWKGRANLTARYITFWNRVYDRLKQINPDVVLTAFAYQSYKNPPPPERKLTARMKIGLVPTYHEEAYRQWKGWREVAPDEGMVLRPNWWHLRGNAPHLPLEEIASFIKFAYEHGLDGIRMDSITGFWATKGASYYLVARLSTNPQLTKDDILAEYTAAFGNAAPKIREYLDYWQKVTTDLDHFSSNVPEVQQFLSDVKLGLYNLNTTGDQTLLIVPLYPDAVVQPGMKILEEAEAMAQGDPEAAERVRFLKDGLREMVATRDTVAVGLKINEARANREKVPAELQKAFEEKAAALATLREELVKRHVLWKGPVERNEYRRGIPTAKKTLKARKIIRKNPTPRAGEDFNDL